MMGDNGVPLARGCDGNRTMVICFENPDVFLPVSIHNIRMGKPVGIIESTGYNDTLRMNPIKKNPGGRGVAAVVGCQKYGGYQVFFR